LARDLAGPSQRGVRVAERGDHHLGPEARAVFAEAPRFPLGPAVPRGAGEYFRRLAGEEVLGRVEAREALTDDLGGRVALDDLRAFVPGRDGAVGLEQEDRILPDPLERERSVPEERW